MINSLRCSVAALKRKAEWFGASQAEQFEHAANGFSSWATSVYGGTAVTTLDEFDQFVTTLTPSEEYILLACSIVQSNPFINSPEHLAWEVKRFFERSLTSEEEEPEGVVRVPRGTCARPEFLLSEESEDLIIKVVADNVTFPNNPHNYRCYLGEKIKVDEENVPIDDEPLAPRNVRPIN